MSNYNVLPLSSFNLELIPGLPTPPVDDEFSVSIRLTMAAIDPNDAVDDEKTPSTLKIIKRAVDFDEDLIYNSEDDDEDEDEDDEEEEEEEEKPVKKAKDSKKSKKADADVMEEDDDEEDDEEDDLDDEDLDLDDDTTEYIICTLSPQSQYQQTLDLVITSGEEVLFVVEGSYPIHLSGNYIEHPYDEDEDDYDEEDEEDDFDSDDYDLSPDDDEIDEDKIRELVDSDNDDEEEEEVEEEVEVEVKPKSKKEQKKENKKRVAEEQEEATSKKQKKADAKKVAFSKELEQGPTTTSTKKPSTKKLEGGVTVEDRTVGEGPTAKSGQTVGIRYIGKLANGKVFDSNTKGKPFTFKLGAGDVIRGMDIGVTGMSVKGERRVVIPAPLAYGKKALPGIPANSELTFDIKVVKIK